MAPPISSIILGRTLAIGGSFRKRFGAYFRRDETTPLFHNDAEKVCSLVALAPLWGVRRVFRGLDVRTDMMHREALILFTGTLRTLPQVLLRFIERHLPAAVYADVLSRTDFLSGFNLFGQFDHQFQIWMGKLFITFDSSNISV
jgi:hypothetical protein